MEINITYAIGLGLVLCLFVVVSFRFVKNIFKQKKIVKQSNICSGGDVIAGDKININVKK